MRLVFGHVAVAVLSLFPATPALLRFFDDTGGTVEETIRIKTYEPRFNPFLARKAEGRNARERKEVTCPRRGVSGTKEMRAGAGACLV